MKFENKDEKRLFNWFVASLMSISFVAGWIYGTVFSFNINISAAVMGIGLCVPLIMAKRNEK